MNPSQVRESILQQHADLRDQLAELREMAVGATPGDAAGTSALREAGLRLLAVLESHLDFEDLHLLPALRKAGARGEERANRVTRDHAEQRELFHYILARLRETDRPSLLVARQLETLVDAVLVDMADEENTMLSADVLRDGAVGIDVETV